MRCEFCQQTQLIKFLLKLGLKWDLSTNTTDRIHAKTLVKWVFANTHNWSNSCKNDYIPMSCLTLTMTKKKTRNIGQISSKFGLCLIKLHGLHRRNVNKSQEKHATSLQSIVSVSFLSILIQFFLLCFFFFFITLVLVSRM